jgi:hypothetical protein
MTLDEWHAERLGGDPEAELLLQMDVEGAEFETLLAASPALMRKFRIMVIEIHELPQLWNGPFFQIASRFFRKLLATHTVVHIHPNNCRKLVKSGGLAVPIHAEFTWLRNDRVRSVRYRKNFPHPLDRPNAAKAPVDLPPCWYAAED